MFIMELKPLNKKGQLGFELVKPIVITVLVLIVLGVVFLVTTVSLRDSNILTEHSAEYNSSVGYMNNGTEGLTAIFSKIPTVMTILAVVIIITAVVLILRQVGSFGKSAGGV